MTPSSASIATNSLPEESERFKEVLFRSPGFWLLVVTTCSIILPRLHLRKVSVLAEILSHLAVRLYFTYTRNPTIGSFIRLSERSLIEWHSFATIAKPAEKEFSVVSSAGDWTKHRSELVLQSCECAAFLPVASSTSLIYSALLSLQPCISVLYAGKIQARVFRSTPNAKETFGDEMIESIRAADPHAVIHDTKKDGRPDIVEVTWKLLNESGAEPVFIISNKKATDLVVYATESQGVTTFGAIFDS